MLTEEEYLLRLERTALLIGTVIGQMSELLNSLAQTKMAKKTIYRRLFDIHQSAGLQAHELYYKGNKR